MKTNLEKYAEEMSHKIKTSGLDVYHWSEVATVIDELLKYSDFNDQSNNSDICHIGFTNGNQIYYASESQDGEGAFYCDTKNECYIPIYMLKSHLHRVETTSKGIVKAEDIDIE